MRRFSFPGMRVTRAPGFFMVNSLNQVQHFLQINI